VEKSPTYWDADQVRLQEIHFYPIESEETAERAYRSGQLHYVYEMPLSKVPVYQERHPDLIHIDPYLGTYFYRLNVTRKPLDDKRVRRALALAIDRESLVRNVMMGGQIPAYHYTPPELGGYTARARLEGDLAAAKRLLEEAGYPNGQGFPSIEILYNTADRHRIIAEAIQQMWRQHLNINATLVNQEWKVYLDSSRALNYQISRAGWIGDYIDPKTFLDMFVTGGGQNQTGFSHPEYDKLIALANLENDPHERYEIFQQAESILMEELPIIPIFFYTRVYILHPSVKGWHSNILDTHPYKYVHLE
jgi:oligopeptide transport system substrate-binding protein